MRGGVSGLKIAYSANLGYVDSDPEIAGLVASAVRALADLGAHVDEVDPGFADHADTFRTIWWTGAYALLGKLDGQKRELLDPDLAHVVEEAGSITLDDALEATAARAALGRHMREFMVEYDLLVTPSLPIAAFEAGQLAPVCDDGGKWTNWTPFSFPFNLTGQPAASVPCGFTSAGLPAGLQIVGRMHDDVTVLRATCAYEQAHDWRLRRPSL